VADGVYRGNPEVVIRTVSPAAAAFCPIGRRTSTWCPRFGQLLSDSNGFHRRAHAQRYLIKTTDRLVTSAARSPLRDRRRPQATCAIPLIVATGRCLDV
jgi:hypothetical protein